MKASVFLAGPVRTAIGQFNGGLAETSAADLGSAVLRESLERASAPPESVDEVIGSTYVNVVPNLTRGARPYAVVENVIITRRRRGEKLGKLLMEAVLERARAAGCYKVMLLTGSSNPDTHAFYRACGFDGDAKQGYVIRW